MDKEKSWSRCYNILSLLDCLTKFQPNDRVCIIVGPNIHSAEDLLTLFKYLFSKVADVNKVKVEVFPSHHVSTMRGLDKVRLILSDESDYYPPFQQKEVRAVVEGYIGKPNSDPHIIFVKYSCGTWRPYANHRT